MISIFAILFTLTTALRFDILATAGQGTVRCFEQFVTTNTLVKGSVDIPLKPFQKVDFLV